MKATEIPCPVADAEGLCSGVPYDTQLVSIEGVCIHFWIGDRDPIGLPKLIRAARRHRDIVSVTYSRGSPTGYWARQNIEDNPKE